MNKIQNFINDKISPIAAKIAGSKFITCLMGGFNAVMPLILIGSISSLITAFPYFGISEFLANTGLSQYLTAITNFTSGSISLFLLIGIAFNVARQELEEIESRIVSFITLTTFLIVSPLVVPESGPSGVSLQLLGAKGMFVAIILGFIVPSLYLLLVKKGIYIKMPDQVPPYIEKAFKSILPAVIIFILFALIAWGFAKTPYESVHGFIYTIISVPFEKLSNNIFAYIFITFMIQLFWFFGIHGGMTFDAIKNSLFTQGAIDNIAAYGAGQEMTNIVTVGLSSLAGSGTAQGLGLIICLYFFTKRDDFKMLSKIACVPQLFGISEPTRFGVPTIFNFTLAIPLLLFQPILEFIAYLCCEIGILSLPRTGDIRNMPFLLSGFMAGGISGVIFQVFALIFSVLFFLPFVKMYEKQKNEQDKLS